MDLLTDLEAAAIGHIFQNQPCTAHFIRSCFKNSQLTKFSDSAGSVYPMMKRLDKRELIASKKRQDGHRLVRYFSVTKSGRAAFRIWMGPPISNSASLSIDPLRTRSIYLRHLSTRRRRQWLDGAETLIRQKLLEVSSYASVEKPGEQSNDIFYDLANENAVMELKTRLKWIQYAREKLSLAGLVSDTED